MFIDIDYAKKSLKPQLYVAKPDKKIIGRLKTAYNINQVIKLGRINELSFQLPFDLEGARNHEVDQLKYRYLIKFELGDYEEWYRIETPAEHSDDSSDYKQVYCFSQGYDLHDKNIRAYSVSSYNAISILTELLQDTGWTVDYINPEFNNTYRSLQFSSTNKLDAVYNIASTFGGVLIFDTLTKKISLFREDEIGQNKGLQIKYGKYLKGISHEVNPDKIATRLKCFGKDGLSIQRVNVTGQNYIEDFSYFLLPFERDENRNVLQSSDYMSDGLCHAILDYFELLDNQKGDVDNLLTQKATQENDLIIKENELFQMENQLTIILDDLYLAMESGGSTSQLIQDRDNKIAEIAAKKAEITAIKNAIQDLDSQITTLKNNVSRENNFTPQELEELSSYIIEKELVDENYIDENDLYQAGLKELAQINTPEAVINVNIVNFLEIIEEQLNWDKLVLGDYLTIQHDKLNIGIQAKIIELQYDYEQGDINLTIANIKDVSKSAYEKVARMLYKSASTANLVDINKNEWNKMVYNFNRRNDRNPVKPANPTIDSDGTAIDHVLNSDGSADISFEWNFTGSGEAYDIDGFIIYVNSFPDNTSYVFGATVAKEQVFNLSPEKRAFILYGVPADRYYTFGVQAYRVVDDDIYPGGILKSDIIQPSLAGENPYQPSNNIAFAGDITGTVDGIAAQSVRQAVEDFGSLVNEMPNPYFEEGKANWSKDYNGETVSQLTEGTIVLGVGTSGGKVLELQGTHWIYGAKPIPVNVNRQYKIRFKVRQTVDAIIGDSRVYAGVATLDADYQNLTGGAGTHRYCAVSSQMITVSDGWQTYEGIITGIGDTHNNFREGTVYVRPMFIVNYNGGDGTVRIDALEFYDVTEVGDVAENFNQRNDRISVTPANPTLAADGTAVDHTINTDGSADISLEWGYTGTGDAYNIDGFIIYVYSNSSSSTYNFGTTPSSEQTFVVDKSKRALILYGVSANRYYTLGVLAYRIVDEDINAEGILKSSIVKATAGGENPYRPAAQVSFAGDVTGTINGKQSDEINKSSSTFIVADQGTSQNYKQADYVVPSGADNAQDYINSAINAIAGVSGKVVLLEGTYNCNGSILLPSNVKLEGMGLGTVIKNCTTASVDLIKNADQTNGNVNININNLTVDGNTYSQSCIQLKYVDNSLITDCSIKNQRGGTEGLAGGVYLRYCNKNVIQGNIFENNTYSIYVRQSDNNTFNSNICKNSNFGIILSGDEYKNNITSNIFIDGVFGIYVGIDSYYNNVVGNTCNNNTAWGIRCLGEHNSICDNYLYQNAYQYPEYDDPQILLEGWYNNVQNNVIRRGDIADGCGYGIDVSGRYNVITNNDLYQSGFVSSLRITGSYNVTTAGNRT